MFKSTDGQINGKFEGDFFIVEKGVDMFVTELDEQFKEWTQKEEGKVEKKD